MTTLDFTPTDAVLVAIDIVKVRNEVLIESSDHKGRCRLSVLNSRAEHDRLVEILQLYGRPVVCALEATGNYHRPIAWRLAEAGFEVRLVSSLALARTREALHNGWDKNDPKDAQVILHMLRIQATILKPIDAWDEASFERFWNEFSATPSRFTEASREHYAKLYALPGAMHLGFAQFATFDQDAIDNRAYLVAGGKPLPPGCVHRR